MGRDARKRQRREAAGEGPDPSGNMDRAQGLPWAAWLGVGVVLVGAAVWLGMRQADETRKAGQVAPDASLADVASLLGVDAKVPEDAEGLRRETTAICEGLVRSLKDRPEAYTLLALMRYRYGLKEEARQAWQEAIRLNEKFSPAHLGLGLVAADMGQDAEAATMLRRAISLNPSLEDAYAKLVEVLLRQNETDEALRIGQEFVERFPKNKAAAFWLGQVHMQLQHYEEAVAAHEAVIRQYPDFAASYNSLATAHARLGHRQEAAAARKKFAEVKEKDLEKDRNQNRQYEDPVIQRQILAETHFSAGDVHRNVGHLRMAEAHWLRGIQVQREDVHCREALVALYQSQERWSLAAQMAGQIARLNAEDPAAWLTLGRLHRRAGSASEAETAFRRAIALQPEAASNYLELLQVALEAGRPLPDGLALARKAVELERSPDACIMLSSLLDEAGDRDGARAAIEDGLKSAPGDPRLRQAHELLLKDR